MMVRNERLKHVRNRLARFQKKVLIWIDLMKKPRFKKPDGRVLVFCCNGVVPHGGWIDRLKGMLSCYELALQEQLDFRIVYTSPVTLTDFFGPGTHDWQPDDEGYHPFYSRIVYHMDDFEADIRKPLRSHRIRRFYYFYNIDALPTLRPDLNTHQLHERWRSHFHTLFTMTPFMTEQLPATPSAYVSCHARFTSLLGDFADTTQRVLPEEAKRRLIEDVRTLIERVQAASDKPVYIFSDSTSFLAYCQTLPNVQVTPGTPAHTGVSHAGSATEAFVKTLQDFHFLASSERIFLLLGRDMYNSAFSRYAAIMGNAPFEILQPD